MKIKFLHILTIIAVFSFIATSCQKEDTEKAIMKLRATIADHYTLDEGSPKVAMDGLQPKFITDDQIWINEELFTATVTGGTVELEGAEVSTPYYAVYPYELVPDETLRGFPMTIDLPTRQSYEYFTSNGKKIQKINAPMAAYSSTDRLAFQNICALLRVRVRNNVGMGDFHLDSIRITCDKAIAGTGTINYDDEEGVFSLTASGKYSVTLTGINEDVLENKSSLDYYIYIPPVTGGQFTITTYGIFPDKTIAEFEIAKTTTANISKNSIAATSQLLKTSDHRYIRPFTVGVNTRVYFSPGNLQWSNNGGATHSVNGGGTAAGTWRFAEEQWISYTNTTTEGGNTLSEDDAKETPKWLDLFGWGTSGWSGCGNDFYMPYNRNYYNSGNQKGYGPRYQTNAYSLIDTYDKSDWGVYNAILNGNTFDSPGMWRTLTSTEWDYIIKTRSNSNNLRTAAIVNGITGYMFLPDGWELPEDISMVISSTAANNNYTRDQWSKLQANGAIFLPATGYGGGTSGSTTATNTVTNVNRCYYWTSTSGSSIAWAYRFLYDGTTAKIDGNYTDTYRYLEYAVRLVRDVE